MVKVVNSYDCKDGFTAIEDVYGVEYEGLRARK